MTDKERLLTFLDEMGIAHTETKEGSVVFGDYYLHDQTHIADEKEAGYVGFYTEFVFDSEGKLVEYGAFE